MDVHVSVSAWHRESPVSPVPPVVSEPLECRECLVSVEPLVTMVQRERE